MRLLNSILNFIISFCLFLLLSTLIIFNFIPLIQSKYEDLSLDNTKKVIRGNNYENMFRLTWALQDKNEGEILNLIDLFCNEGIELKEFIDVYFEFNLDLIKYIIFQNITITNIPEYLATKDNQVVQQTVNIEHALDWFNALTDVILTIKTEIKYDTTYVSTIEAYLLRFCRTWKN